MQEVQKENNEKHNDEKQNKQWVKPDLFVYPVEKTMDGGGELDDGALMS